MKPQIVDMVAWEQAEMLMQPALIRLIDNIRKQLENSAWKATYEEVTEPYPGYHLCLEYQEKKVRFDLWQICYQICFRNYIPGVDEAGTQEVEIDTSLIDDSIGDVNWENLDNKAKEIVENIFSNLPI